MTKKNIIISILAVALFGYVLWDAVDYLKTKKNQQKEIDTISNNKKMDINDCVVAATKHGSLTKEQADKYCNCFLTYIKEKYTEIQLKNLDSILQIETAKAKQCIDDAKR